MADAGTIVVLDGIQFQKETTSDIYTQDHATNEAVKTFDIHIPMSAKAARVIFNGAYDPNGGRFHGRVKATMVTSITTPTKTANTQVMEWSTITPPAVLDSGSLDCSASWYTDLHIDIAQSSVTANTTGIEIIVQIRKEDALDEWTDLPGGRFNALSYAAVAVKSDFSAQEAALQTILSVTAPTTGKLTHLGKFVFLEDTASIAQCEIAFVVECGADA